MAKKASGDDREDGAGSREELEFGNDLGGKARIETLTPEQEAEELGDFLHERGIEIDPADPGAAKSARRKARQAIAEARGEEVEDDDGEPEPAPVRHSQRRKQAQQDVAPEGEEGGEGDVVGADVTDEQLNALAEGLGLDLDEHPGAAGHRRREAARESREIEAYREHNQKLTDLVTAIVTNLKREAGGGTPAGEEGGEEGVDWLADGDTAFHEAIKPTETRIEQLERELRMEQHRNTVRELRDGETRYDREGDPANGIPPGYLYRANRADDLMRQEWRSLGIKPEKIEEMLVGRRIGAVRAAQELGVDPWRLVDADSIRALRANGVPLTKDGVRTSTQAPRRDGKVAAAGVRRRDGSIAAARAASESAVAGGKGQGGASGGKTDVSDVSALLEAGVTPEHIDQVFAEGGRKGFLDLMEKLERSAAQGG